MTRKLFAHLGIQACILIAVVLMAVLPAIILTGLVGGISMGLVPEATFGLVDQIVCPEGTLEFYTVKRSYHEPGESEPHVECVNQDGVREDVLFPAIFSVLGGTFAIVFAGIIILVYAPLAVAAFFITRRKQIKPQIIS